jgi:hypothetical protein
MSVGHNLAVQRASVVNYLERCGPGDVVGYKRVATATVFVPAKRSSLDVEARSFPPASSLRCRVTRHIQCRRPGRGLGIGMSISIKVAAVSGKGWSDDLRRVDGRKVGKKDDGGHATWTRGGCTAAQHAAEGKTNYLLLPRSTDTELPL